jgi:oxygen-dependent protoporphyrinogen oxidase
MKPVQIIGGGITGLTAAWRLQARGIPFELFESSNRVGGVIRTQRSNGFVVESGPNTILETFAEVTDLIRDLGLQHRRIYPSCAAAKRYIAHAGVPVALPQAAIEAVKTPLLSFRGKLRVAAEPFVAPGHGTEDESLASFVERRFGRDLLDSIVDPFVAGIYAGNAAELSVHHAFPKLYALERDYGSVISGAVRGRRKRSHSATKSKVTARMFSFDAGLELLPQTLHERMRLSIKLNSAPRSLYPRSTEPVLICAPAAAMPDLMPNLEVLGQIHYAPVARVALGFRTDQVGHALDGFGVLIPSREDFEILGVFFSSSLFPDRAPLGHVLMTVFLGGARQHSIPQQPPDEIKQIALRDVRRLLGIAASPAYSDVEVNPRAIPQYNVGFGRIKAAMADVEQCNPGLFLAGAYRDGVSVSDCIRAGCRAADRIAEYLSNGKENRTAADQHRVA